jgi:hypothetical protein
MFVFSPFPPSNTNPLVLQLSEDSDIHGIICQESRFIPAITGKYF